MSNNESPICAAVAEWLAEQKQAAGDQEDFDQLLERHEVVDLLGIQEAGVRMSWAAFSMMEENGIERGIALHSIVCMLVGARLARRNLL